MNKLVFIAFIFSNIYSFVQNVQLHYDFAEEPHFFTTIATVLNGYFN